MRRSISALPKQYTILISRTGEPPITLSVQPRLLLSLIAMAIALPTFWIGSVIFSYAQRNRALLEENTQLTEEATSILEQVEVLESEIQNLQERAGIEDKTSSINPKGHPSQGGVVIPIEAEQLLRQAKAQIPKLFKDLRGDVQPALEATLEREDALPQGIPLKGQFEQSSNFGLRRNPFGGRGYEFHNGVDFKGSYGSPVFTTAPGVVEVAEFSGGYGNHVIINHGYGYRTLYAHLSEIKVTPGIRVERDRLIGNLGNTGRSTGPHLHYTIYRNNAAVDPQSYLD